MSLPEIRKYPRTPHIEGSCLQVGDEGYDRVSIKSIKREFPNAIWVIEEKLDGANTGLSLHPETYELLLQCRGHYLAGGARERQFAAFKEWAAVHEAELMNVLEDRYVSYHEWTFAVHTQYYDALPHYLHEFDVYDKERGFFLSTQARQELLRDTPYVSVPVLHNGHAPYDAEELESFVRPSLYRTHGWRENLTSAAREAGVSEDVALANTGDTDLSEGVYVKIEDGEETVARFKWVRHGFLQTILDSGTHWSARPMIRNSLTQGTDIMAKPRTEGVEP